MIYLEMSQARLQPEGLGRSLLERIERIVLVTAWILLQPMDPM